MRHFINILVIFVLVGLAVGITYVQVNNPDSVYGFLYIPLIIMMFLWGDRLNNEY